MRYHVNSYPHLTNLATLVKLKNKDNFVGMKGELPIEMIKGPRAFIFFSFRIQFTNELYILHGFKYIRSNFFLSSRLITGRNLSRTEKFKETTATYKHNFFFSN